jgi:hypothetical protein
MNNKLIEDLAAELGVGADQLRKQLSPAASRVRGRSLISVVAAVAVVVSGVAYAQSITNPTDNVPRAIAYEGFLEQSGEPVVVQTRLGFALLDENDAQLWPATGTEDLDVTPAGGRFAVVLGDAGQESLPDSVFDADEVYVSVTVDPDGAASALLPRQRIEAVPFARKAGVATSAVQASTAAAGSDLEGWLVPAGTIVMWSGSLANIPAGWAECNGQNGTPDLQNRFPLGTDPAGNPPGFHGGGAHNHAVGLYRNPGSFGSGIAIDFSWPHWDNGLPTSDARPYTYVASNGTHSQRMTTTATTGFPPFTRITFIMKLP